MTTELWMLTGVVIVFMLVVAIQAVTLITTLGPVKAAGNRDDVEANQTGLLGRAQRTVQNHIEGLAMFTPLILVGAAAGISSPWTILGAQIYLASRVVHALSYLAGIVMVRTIAFAAGIFSLIQILIGLLAH